MGARAIYINGGTGFIGRALCAALLNVERNEQPQLFVQTRMPGHHRHRAITFVSAYADLPDGIAPEVIINLAGAPIADNRWSESQKKLLLNSRIKVTEGLLRSIQKKGHRPEVLLNASAIGYYGISDSASLTEQAPSGGGFAADLCQQWESAAGNFEALGTRVCIMRIGVVLGERGGVLAKLLPIYRLGMGGPIGTGKQWFSWIHIEDLVNLFIEAIRNPMYRGAINCTAPNPVRQIEFARQLGGFLRRPTCFRTPATVLKFIYGQMAEELLISGQGVVPAFALAQKFRFKFPQLNQALQQILLARH